MISSSPSSQITSSVTEEIFPLILQLSTPHEVNSNVSIDSPEFYLNDPDIIGSIRGRVLCRN